MEYKTKLFIAVLIFGIVLVSGCTNLENSSEETIGLEEQDISICNKMSFSLEKDRCYSDLAESKGDFSICHKISLYPNDNEVNSCFARVAKNSSFFCSEIQSNHDQGRCYIGVGIVTQDTTNCDKIITQSLKNKCYTGIAGVKGDISICEKIEDKYFPYNACIRQVAIVKQDISMCDKIQDSSNTKLCYSGIIRNKKDLSLCDEVKDSFKDACYFIIATEKKDASLCEKIENVEYQEECLNKV